MEKLEGAGMALGNLFKNGAVDGETRRLLVIILVLCVGALVAIGLNVYKDRKSRRRH